MLIIGQEYTDGNKISMGIGFRKGVYALCAAGDNHGGICGDILREINLSQVSGANDCCFQ